MKKTKNRVSDILAQAIQGSAPQPKPKLKNHIILLLDDSGSMSNCYRTAVDQVNKNLANAREQARVTGQETTITVYLFGDRVHRAHFQVPVDRVEPLSYHFASGSTTRLRDAICGAIADALGLNHFGRTVDNGKRLDSEDPNTSYLLVCATDGGENSSHVFARELLPKMIAEAQASDRWTFAMLVPPGAKAATVALGIPEGNVAEWTNDRAGTEVAFTRAAASTSSYYAARGMGMKSTKNFFTTDLSSLKKSDLSKLADLSGNFKSWVVNREVDIKAFVESHGCRFVLGAGYYQVTKKEKLRTGRNVLVREKGTNRIFGGAQARQVLGIPSGEVIVTPGNHANFDIFFQSTSVNRKLVRGTELLLDRTQVTDLPETWDSAAAQAIADAKKQPVAAQP